MTPRVKRARNLAGAFISAALAMLAAPAVGLAQERVAGCVLDAETPPPVEARSITVTFYGVSTLMFDDGESRLLIDGFFSRPETLAGRLWSKPGIVADRMAGALPVSAVLFAHAHHDHAMDLEAVAQAAPEAVIVGTPAVGLLAASRHVAPERICAPTSPGPNAMRYGRYRVTAFDTPHGDSPFYIRWFIDHELKAAPKDGDRFWSFKDGKNRSYLIENGSTKILVHPSASPAQLGGLGAQVVFMGIGRLGSMPDKAFGPVLASVLGDKPATVIPIHWDSFARSLDKPLVNTPWPGDKVPLGFERLCAYTGPKGWPVRRMEALSAVRITPAGEVEPVTGTIRDGCDPATWPKKQKGPRKKKGK